MNSACYRFSLSMQSNQSQVSLPVLLNDTGRRLLIKLVDNGKPYYINDGCRAVFYAVKSDGNVLVNDCIIEKNAKIRYDFTAQTASVKGVSKCEIRLYGTNGRLITSPKFIMVVDSKVVYDDEVLASYSEFTTLDGIIATEKERVEAEAERVIKSEALLEELRQAIDNIPNIDGDSSDVYILSDGETIEDAPEEADVVIDPNGETDLVDATLSVEGQAADAKATGDAIDQLNEDVFAAISKHAARIERVEIHSVDTTAAINEHTTQIEQNSTRITGLSEELTTERARIDNFASLGEGSTTGDAELIDTRVGYLGNTYASAGDAMRGQSKHLLDKMVLQNEIVQDNAFYERVSNGHFYRIPADKSCMGNMWIENATTGAFEVGSTTTNPAMPPRYGTGFIKAPKYLCVNTLSTSATFYIFFYDLVDGEYVIRWDCICKKRSSRKMNYITHEIAKGDGFVYEIPDGAYLQILDFYNVEFYGWDGIPFGMPLSADLNSISNTGAAGSQYNNGSYTITVPGSARFLVTNGCSISTIVGYVGTTATTIATHATATTLRRWLAVPSGYDFLRVRLTTYDGTTALAKVYAGDVSDMVSVVVHTEADKASGRALPIIENCKKMSSLRWTPKVNVKVNSATNGRFYAGIEWMGIPYGSDWKTAHYIGWHVSPHTFINAVNDADSIFYKETVTDGSVTAPYYSTVCSAFATMCAGWPYPQINGGFLYDPNVELHHTSVPPIGEIYTSLSHVVIPERIDHLDGDTVVSAYESTRPVAQRTSRFLSGKTNVLGTYPSAAGYDFYEDYGYAVYNYLSDPDMSKNVPYIGMSDEDLAIVNGSARPYKGDKSVYTSAESTVNINIKDTAATILYLMKDGEEPQSITIDGATQIDVKPYLNGDGIYYVYTDVSDTTESFEYHIVETITYTMVNGVPVLSSIDFWYIMFMMSGDPRVGNARKATSQLPASDYSYLIKNGATCNYVYSVFRKGEYGAYAVPVSILS